jgi:hypothetical protein
MIRWKQLMLVAALLIAGCAAAPRQAAQVAGRPFWLDADNGKPVMYEIIAVDPNTAVSPRGFYNEQDYLNDVLRQHAAQAADHAAANPDVIFFMQYRAEDSVGWEKRLTADEVRRVVAGPYDSAMHIIKSRNWLIRHLPDAAMASSTP